MTPERRDGAIHSAAHRYERPAGRGARELRHGSRGVAESTRQRVRGQLGRVPFSRAQAAELGGDFPDTDRGRLEERSLTDEGDRRAGGRSRRSTPASHKAGITHAHAVELNDEIELVAA